jgi:hypothetical protein
MPKTPSRNDDRRAITGLCALCGSSFTLHGRRRFCDDACRQAAWRERFCQHSRAASRAPASSTSAQHAKRPSQAARVSDVRSGSRSMTWCCSRSTRIVP